MNVITDTKTPFSSDGATKERMRQGGGVIVEKREINEKNGKVLRVGHRAKYPTVFHYYEALNHLSGGQREAGCTMAVKYYIAGRVPSMPIAWVKECVASGSVKGYNPSDAKIDAEDWLRNIEKQLRPQEEFFIRQACLYDQGVGGEGDRNTLRRIAVLSNGLRIVQHILGIPE